MNNHAVGAEVQGNSFALCSQMNVDPIGILQPQLALTLSSRRPPDASLTVDTIEIFNPPKVVNRAGRIEARNPDATDPETAYLERVVSTLKVQGAATPAATTDKRDLNLADGHRARGLGRSFLCDHAGGKQA